MRAHQRSRIVEQHLYRMIPKSCRLFGQDHAQTPGDPAELSKRTFESGKPALLAFMAERPHLQAARIAKRRDQQQRLDLDAGDVDQALANIDLRLLAGRRLKSCRRPSLRRKGSPIRLNRPLDRAQADDDAFLAGELLAHHIGVAAVALKAFLEPAAMIVEQLAPSRLPIAAPAARLDGALDRVAADPKLPRDPPRAPSKLLHPEHGRHRLRFQHRFPPRFFQPRRG